MVGGDLVDTQLAVKDVDTKGIARLDLAEAAGAASDEEHAADHAKVGSTEAVEGSRDCTSGRPEGGAWSYGIQLSWLTIP